MFVWHCICSTLSTAPLLSSLLSHTAKIWFSLLHPLHTSFHSLNTVEMGGWINNICFCMDSWVYLFSSGVVYFAFGPSFCGLTVSKTLLSFKLSSIVVWAIWSSNLCAHTNMCSLITELVSITKLVYNFYHHSMIFPSIDELLFYTPIWLFVFTFCHQYLLSAHPFSCIFVSLST